MTQSNKITINEDTIQALTSIQAYVAPSPEISHTYDSHYKNVLLTGANGYLGVHLIEQILQMTEAVIFCGIRAASLEEAKKKLDMNLQRYHFEHYIDNSRLKIILINLTQPQLGLDDDAWLTLSDTLDAIYHNGAYVHHLQSFQRMAATNVGSTIEIIKLAATHKLKRIHYISTKYSCYSMVSTTAKEGAPSVAPMNQDLAFGYTTTKWASEWVLWKAQDAGIPVNIYRLGQISGHSVSGENNFEKNNLTRLILGVIAMQAAPKLKNQHEMLPVDFVAKAIVALSNQTYQQAEGWNIVNSRQISHEDLFVALKSIGYEIEMLPNNEWRKKLVAISEQNPLFPLISYYDVDENIEFVHVECEKTLTTLRQLGVILPEDYEQMLQKYLAFWQEQDFNCL